MGMHTLKAIQRIPAPASRVWEFFSNPANLRRITPPGMGFHILSGMDGGMIRSGQVIRYRVKPLWGIPLNWKTLISEVEPGVFFADQQLKGPYRYWRHEHHFQEIPGGTMMTDLVRYQLPAALLGECVHSAVVRKRLRDIFAYRYAQTGRMLGSWEGQTMMIEIR